MTEKLDREALTKGVGSVETPQSMKRRSERGNEMEHTNHTNGGGE